MRFQFMFFGVWLICMSACNTRQAAIQYPEGGYAYLKDISNIDSDYYFLPIRKFIPLEDSITFDSEKYFFKSFAESNLSIKAGDEDVFRLSIDGGGFASSIIITLTTKGLVIKQQAKDNQGSPYPVENKEQLTETERQHYFFLQRFFPYKKRTYTHGRQLYIDSMIESFPRLSDVAYYQYLMNKVVDKNATLFQYDSKIIPLTTKQFISLADSINASGYWSLPYQPVVEATTDGWGFCLEANTAHKYNIVICSGLHNPGSVTDKLKRACQRMVNYAQIKPAIEIWSDGQDH